MVKLDVSLLRYLSHNDFRVLTAVEMGMRNHELVPRSLIFSIASIHNGSISKILVNLTQNKLLSYERGKRYDGYRLTYLGYDYLALNVLRTRGVISSVGNQIGVGKESDVYVACNDEGRQFAIKLHRLGRTCFRKVSEKRDYQKKGQNQKTASWIYLSRLAAIREFAFMKILYERKKLPIPEPIDYNRHCIVMELIDGCILNHIKDIEEKPKIDILYEKLIQIIMKLSNEFGVVHGDFNEFNILIKLDGTYDPVMIDFPQMISVNHELAREYFERDVNCIVDFFAKRFNYQSETIPCFEELSGQENETSELQTLADAMEDEVRFIEHLESKETKENISSSQSEKLQEPICEPQQENDILSKFLNSLPASTEPLEECNLYYNQMDPELVEEAERKVMLEKKLYEMKLSSIDENEQKCDFEVKPSTAPVEHDEDHLERQSVHSQAFSTASTFSQHEIKSRLLKERKKRETRERMKVNPKNIKGDANALLRRKRNDQSLANEDMKAYVSEAW